ncbi:glycerol-3-phosphate 1-O-acyltransferase [Actinomycetospora endophytica]|uniref:Glycerol-3-phosphate 1-O-acyltransferase n=1 Tax=Actinomycetospora endophytica TaxID=2291215 RepID=A0ABS8P9R7_9PSEU|nr:glycerol-3-phosphate 1-O-acyltransferase [Actinomycetospora endophytica]MCD2193764.1 glycerol-3-phosphate 1-O-acyltransferase [Actinomycetospora endophytica]
MAVIVDEAASTPRTDPPVVVLGAARTAPERELLTDWAARNHPEAPVCLDESALHRALRDADPTTTVVPVRVTWLPPTRAAEWADGTGAPPEKPKPADLVALLGPRRPPGFWQRRLARNSPDRVRLVEGEPATLSDLRRRHDAEAREDSLAAYVHRAGVLACERAERALIGDHYTVPRMVVEQIVASTRFRERLRELAGETGRGFEDLLADARARLGELATVQSPVAIDAFRTALAPMHTSAWDVEVDSETVEPLRELNRTAPLVFLPTHRSYADPLVLAEVLRAHDLPRNTMLGGNNMAFWPIGPLGKRAGVVFIRRTSGDDPVYRLALREYIAHLVSKRFNLEWYVEGGRSRTGKLRRPRMGLLSYLTGALDDGRAPDVQLVPTSLVYDRMFEVDAMAAEQGGEGKSAEGLGWLARYVRGQVSNSGTARVRFGEPFSLREALEEAGEGKARLEKVAFTICDGINRATPATPTALVTFALLGAGGRALTLDQIRVTTEPLLDHLDRLGRPGPREGLRGEGIERTLDRLVSGQVADRYAGGEEPVWSVREGRHRVAAFYRNGAIHHFVNRAIVELALLTASREQPGRDPVDVAWEEALALRDLLKFEFFFPPKRRFSDEISAEAAMVDVDWRERVREAVEDPSAATLLQWTRFLVAPRTLRSFVDAQWVVATKLAELDPGTAVDRKSFVRECLGLGTQMLRQGRVARPDSVSTELYGSALDLADNRGLLDAATGTDGAAGRVAFRDEIAGVRERLIELARIEDRLTEELLA